MLSSTNAAFVSLDTAFEKGFRNVAHMKADADLARVHADPRFAALLEKLAGK